MIVAAAIIVVAGNALVWGGYVATHKAPPATEWQTTVTTNVGAQ